MKLRLQNEYKELLKVPKTPLYDWTIEPGEEAPYVRSYIITYHVKTLVMNGAKLDWQYETAVRISKDSLNEPWKAKVVRGSVPFHPDIWPNGRFSGGYGMDDPTMWLYEAINFIGKTLRFQPDLINAPSPSNRDAAAYWLKHKDDKDEDGNRLFPTESEEFPVPVPDRTQ